MGPVAGTAGVGSRDEILGEAIGAVTKGKEP